MALACCVEKEHGLIHQVLPLLNNTDTSNVGNIQATDLCAGGRRCSPFCVGNDSCVCLSGFCLKSDGYSCEDYNECLSGSHNCKQGESCINTEGLYRCQRETSCDTGYELINVNTCQDVDECTRPHSACQGHDCVNLLGSFRCDCHSGFTFNSNSETCEDNNECKSYPWQLCAHKCEETPSSYQCSCHPGFKLASDGKNCEGSHWIQAGVITECEV
ncbi:hypothetical protein AMELA_G00180380 [Ameiurus melas]|uniref:EGF-like domain-containing protein n=1 Tax=Ameiurus melas TaxID=219545 RepID=A0A7J6AA44_AMEME|nr:hypothetical protein AMELA_G00180380 [Ameiurus melas]